ncbi:MAG: IS630 family transposase [Chloroflexi bacterium]|nr:IS630 family transposase [Chloroflexota bacterium]
MASSTIILHLPRYVRRRLERRSRQTHDKVEFRRCQIVLQWATGEKPEPIAQGLGCAVCTVYRTVAAFRQEGEAALLHRKSPGRPRKVSAEQDIALDRAMEQEPRKLGQNFSNWTAHKLGLYLKLAVHAVTFLRHLWALGWRWRRPVPRVASPDPRYAAKARYLTDLRHQARQGRIHLYYADEMDVALLPTLSGRWMRMGHQTEIDTPGQNAKQYVFGAVNYVTGALVWVPWSHKNNVGFRQLLKQVLAGHAGDATQVVMVLYNYRIHKAKAVREWLRCHRSAIRLYFLPTYAPRLNVIERLWRHFRRNVTDNYFFKTMVRLMQAVEAFLNELAASPVLVLKIVA